MTRRSSSLIQFHHKNYYKPCLYSFTLLIILVVYYSLLKYYYWIFCHHMVTKNSKLKKRKATNTRHRGNFLVTHARTMNPSKEQKKFLVPMLFRRVRRFALPFYEGMRRGIIIELRLPWDFGRTFKLLGEERSTSALVENLSRRRRKKNSAVSK